MSSSAERPAIEKESYCASQLVAKGMSPLREEMLSWDSQPGAEPHQPLGLDVKTGFHICAHICSKSSCGFCMPKSNVGLSGQGVANRGAGGAEHPPPRPGKASSPEQPRPATPLWAVSASLQPPAHPRVHKDHPRKMRQITRRAKTILVSRGFEKTFFSPLVYLEKYFIWLI